MTILLWGLSLALLAFLTQRQWTVERAELRAARPPYPVGLFCDERVQVALAARPAKRAASHTGAAVLALALALDVSGAQQAWSPPASLDQAHAAAAFEWLRGHEQPVLDLIAYEPAGWTAASSTMDGWFV